MLALSRLANVADDPAADGVERVVIPGGEDHQRLVRTVGKAALGHKAQRDLVALIGASSLDKTVEVVPLADHAGHGHKDAVEKRGFIVRMGGVFLLQVLHKLRHVKLVGKAYLAVGPVRHQVGHDALQAGHISDPASVPSVAPSSLLFGHSAVPP